MSILTSTDKQIIVFLDTQGFLPLTSDLVFKVFLTGKEDLAKCILNDFLPLPKNCYVVYVKFLNPEIYPEKLRRSLSEKQGKLFILDLKVETVRQLPNNLTEKDLCNVEMQTTGMPYLNERVVVYSCRLHSKQLDEGDDFSQLQSVTSVLFSTKNLPVFKKIQDYYHVCRIKREGREDVTFSEKLCFVVIELDKFDKKIDEVNNRREAWLYLLKNSSQLTKETYLKLKEKGGEMIDKALHRVWEISQDSKLREYEEARQKQHLDQLTRENVARREGLRKGIEQNQQGIALQMLKMKMDVSTITQATGLSKKQVLELQKKTPL